MLINTEDFVVLGVGSEWLWLAVAGLVLAGTFVAIYRQLRIQRHDSAIAQLRELDEQWLGSERMARIRVAALTAIRDGKAFAEIPPRVLEITDFWEGVGNLVRSGHLDVRLVNEQRSQSIRMWWGFMAPLVRGEREHREAPWIGRDFEWLAGKMAELDRAAGRKTSFDESYIARMLPAWLAYNQDMVTLAEECRHTAGEPQAAPRARAPRPRSAPAS